MSAPAAAILDELARRVGLASTPQGRRPARWKEYYQTLLPQQQALCETAARWVASVTPRRAGKSTTAAALLLDAAERYPRTAVYYVHPGGGTLAVETMMGPDINIEALAEQYGLPLRWNGNTRTFYHQRTRTEIRLRGADDVKEVRKLRGHKMSRAVIDESQNFPSDTLRRIIDRDLGPSLMDCQGQLYLLGNVGDICRPGDPWYDITRNETPASREQRDGLWEMHEWLALDNVYVREQAATELGQRLSALGATMGAEAITAKLLAGGAAGRKEIVKLAEALKAWDILREHFGIWVHDAEGLVYRFRPELNTYVELPRGHTWIHVLAADLGTGDEYAEAVWAVAPTHPVIYEVHSFAQAGLNADQWRERYQEQRARWNPRRCTLDEGGLGRGIGDAWRASGIPVEPAPKDNKLAEIALFNADLEAGRAKVRAGKPLASEWVALRHAAGGRPGVYAVTGKDHVSDSGLYGRRIAVEYRGADDRPAEELLPAEAREKREIDALRRHLQAQEMREKSLTSVLGNARVAAWRK